MHNFESGVFHRQGAWHRLGNVWTDENRPMTVEEAITLGGLDWDAIARPVFFNAGQQVFHNDDGDSDDSIRYNVTESALEDGNIIHVPGAQAIVRSSDNAVLGMAGKKYRILQNREAFSFFNPFLQDGQAHIETAMSLDGGRKVCILAKINAKAEEVTDGDEVNAYLLLFNSHDGTTAVGILFTPIRVVCENTLNMALNLAKGKKKGNGSVKIRHTAGMKESLGVVQEAIDLGRRTFDVTIDLYRRMQRKQLPIAGLQKYLRTVWDVPAAVQDEKDFPRAFKKIEELVENGAGTQIKGVKGTVWGAYNAVTEWIDHERGRNDSTRLQASWFGTGVALRDRALSVASEIVS